MISSLSEIWNKVTPDFWFGYALVYKCLFYNVMHGCNIPDVVWYVQSALGFLVFTRFFQPFRYMTS